MYKEFIVLIIPCVCIIMFAVWALTSNKQERLERRERMRCPR